MRGSIQLRIIVLLVPVCILFMLSFLLTIMSKLGKLQTVSLQRKRLIETDKLSLKIFKSLKIEMGLIGNYFALEPHLPFGIIYFVINCTLTLLITFK